MLLTCIAQYSTLRFITVYYSLLQYAVIKNIGADRFERSMQFHRTKTFAFLTDEKIKAPICYQQTSAAKSTTPGNHHKPQYNRHAAPMAFSP